MAEPQIPPSHVLAANFARHLIGDARDLLERSKQPNVRIPRKRITQALDKAFAAVDEMISYMPDDPRR